MTEKQFQDKVVIVTGASDGIGAAIAKRFGELGASVAVNFNQNMEGALGVVQKIRDAGGEAEAIQADVSDLEQVDLMISTAVDNFGKIDVLINNVGIYPVTPFFDLTDEEWDRVIDINLRSVFLCSQAAARQMVKNEINGSIISISSIEARSPAPNHIHYCTSKAGVEMFTRTLALELGEYGIRVNAVAPGLIWKDGLEEAWPEGVSRWKKSAPLSRLGQGLDIANACVFLASPQADWITGEILTVDGGILSNPTY